jgi:hypothetical protein
MTNQERTERAAFAEAGTRAYRAVAEHGQQTGGAIIRGQCEAILLAHVALFGWESTFDLVRRQARGRYVPACGSKLQLVVSNTAEILQPIPA